MMSNSENAQVTSKEYNERYRRTRPVMYGDIESLYMALSATDDYLLWLTHVQGWTLPGSGALIRQQVADARAIAKAIYGAGPDEVNAPETRAGAAMREAGKHVFCGATPNWIDHAGDCDALPCTCGLSEWLNANQDLLGITLSPSQKAGEGRS